MSRQILLQILAIFTGGGLVQLAVFLLRRRGELKALDRTSESSLLTGASDLAAQLSARVESQDATIVRLEKRIDKMVAAAEQEKAELLERLEFSDKEIRRLRGLITRLRNDLAISQGQNDELRRLVNGIH